MPSRHNRNARNKHITQQPTPSSRPSPNTYPSSLPDSANNSSDDVRSVSDRGRLGAGPGPPAVEPARLEMKGQTRTEQEQENRMAEIDNVPESVPPSPLIDIVSEPDTQPSLPTPPIPEALHNHAPLSLLWDDTETAGHVRSPILSTLSAANSANSSKNLLGEAFARAAINQASDSSTSNSSTSPPSPTSTSPAMLIPFSMPPPSPALSEGFTGMSGVQNATASIEQSFQVRTEATPSRTGATTSNASPIRPSDSEPSTGPSAPNVNLSARTADLNDMTLDMIGSESHSMEGTIRPSKRASSGYGYGFSASMEGDAYGGDAAAGGYGGPSTGHSRRTSYGQTVRGSGLSQAMAYPASRSSGSQPYRAQQYQYEHAGATIGRRRPSLMTEPATGASGDKTDTIIWAKWDHGVNGRRLLFLSYYSHGMQIWDCTDLGSISEVLNLSAASVQELVSGDSGASIDTSVTPSLSLEYAGIITRPQNTGLNSGLDDSLSPLVGMLMSQTSDDKSEEVDEVSDSVILDAEVGPNQASHGQQSTLLVYSLAKHQVVKKVELAGLAIGGGRFEVGDGFVVVSTTQPPSIYVLSSSTFEVLHHIPSSDLVPFCHKSSSHGISSSQSSSRRHSFLATTSSIVNGIYNNYHEHFNDNHNNNNNKNVLLPTVDNLSMASSPSTEAGLYEYPHQRHPTLQEQSSRGASTRQSTVIPESSPVPAPVFSVSGRLLAYASLPYGDASSHLSGVQPRTSSTLSSAAVSTASAFGSTLSAQFANFSGAGGGASGALGALGGINQADLGNAALKVGGSVLSGMKSLGGLAYKGAVAATSASVSSSEFGRDGLSMTRGAGAGARVGGGVGALANRFFSKSAPAATASDEDRKRRTSVASSEPVGIEGYESGKTAGVSESSGNRRTSTPQRTVPLAESGFYVTILDIAPLLSASESTGKSATFPQSTGTGNANSSQRPVPTLISQFVASKSQPIASIWFSPNGTSLLITPRDGQSVSVVELQINPTSRKSKEEERDIGSSPSGKSKAAHARRSSVSNVESPPVHMYNLRRGRTPAAIESANWASDGRWVAIGTRKRTVHVFAVNPYGGRSDIRSHMEGKVGNYTELPPMPTDLYPLVRLRVTKNPTSEQPKVPLAFLFLESSWEAEQNMPANLLPPVTSPHSLPSHPGSHQHSYGSVSSNQTVMSSSPSTRSEPISPSRQYFSPSGRPRNYQDVLVFDPTDGTLSLRRITVEVKPKSNGAGFVGMSGSSISRSLPGMGAAGRLSISASPNASSVHGRIAASGILQAEGGEFIGKEQTVATWNLRRGRDWGEIKKVLEDSGIQSKTQSSEKSAGVQVLRIGKADWLSQAELSTCSKSARVLPRSVYLSHQFSFHALGEDYHALIRRYQFDFAGTKIEVRKGVEVSAYPTGSGESFVEGGNFTALRDSYRVSSSFDEPLASALTGDMDHAPTQAVLPMLPNGTPGSKPRSFIPIRTTMTGLSDGMSESIGRFRREMTKVRSPKLRATSDNSTSASVPLEFDEEDEDFVSRDSDWPRGSDFDQEPGPTSPVLAEGSRSSPSVPTPAMDPLDSLIPDDDVSIEDWQGWGREDKKAVEEAETFDHISAVGFLDEEQEMMAKDQALALKSKKTKSRKKRH